MEKKEEGKEKNENKILKMISNFGRRLYRKKKKNEKKMKKNKNLCRSSIKI
jgi:hypothetical protein